MDVLIVFEFNLEIIRAVGMSSSTQKDNLYSLLDTPLSQLEPDCFNRALLTAINTDNAILIGELVLRGATNIQEALTKSEKDKKLHSMVMLLILTAVTTDDNSLLAQLIGNAKPIHNLLASVSMNQIRQIITTDTDFLNTPIEIARIHQNKTAFHDILLHSRVNEATGKVDWHGHDLSGTYKLLFHEFPFPWVRHLVLSSTKISKISNTFHSNLMLCTTLELQGNNIKRVPNGIFELPFIKEIDISHNNLIEMYDDCRWSDSLESVNLSHNMLTYLSVSVVAPYLRSLDISHNRFDYIPSCLKNFKLLRNLNVSYNVSIIKIPITLGFLKHLTKLELEGLTNVVDPPRDVLNDFTTCMEYLNDKLYHNTPFYHLRLMLMGLPGVGKTTLAHLLAKNSSTSASDQGENVFLSEWSYSPSSNVPTHHYSIWDVPGKEEYKVAINLFLRKRTLYLLLWNITEGVKGIAALHKVMYNLSIYAPGCCVIIVATFLDCISTQDRQAGKIQQLLQHVAWFSKQFPLIGVSHITAISLQNKCENFSKLRQYIYQAAQQFCIDNVPVMGEMLSENHHIIYQHIKHLQKQASDESRIGYMNKKEFIDVQISSLRKLHFLDSTDVFDLLSFFHSAGFLFQTKGLYVFHPSWLFKAVSSLTANHHKELISQGVVRRSHLLYILGCEHQAENDVLRILQKSSIALPLDNERSYFFLPHCLLAEKPNDAFIEVSFLRYFTFKSPISDKFWNQLFVYLIFTIPEIRSLLSSIVPMKGLTYFTTAKCMPSTTYFKFWQEGISCKTADFQFHVELLKPSRGHNGLERIMVCSSPSKQSVQIFCRILDAIFELIRLNFSESDKILQQVSCMACLRAGGGNSAQLTIGEKLWSAVRNGKSYTVCSLKAHNLTLRDLLPECYLVDFDPTMVLTPKGISCEKTAQVAINGSCSVYKGTVKDKDASILFYNVENWNAKLRMLRHDVRLLDSLDHPCIASFLGCSLLPEILLSFEPTQMEERLDEILSHEKISISRILLYRIAVQIASALNYLHQKGIALGNLNTSNILMMSLDLDVLVNCKILCFSSAAHIDYSNIPCNNQPVIPDIILSNSKAIVDFRADMFLYSLFLYHLITRHAPFYNLAKDKVMDVLFDGGRPLYENDIRAKAGLCHMTQIMKQCWKCDPDERLPASTVTQQLNDVSMQLLMGVHYINSELSLRNICSVVDKSEVLKELWLCYDANEELDLIICNAQTLEKECSLSMPKKQVCSIHQHEDTMWVASRLGLEEGTVDLYSIESRKHKQKISLPEQSVMSITSTESDVYVGTYEGFCYKLPADDSLIPSDPNDYQSQALSDYSIQGLVVVNNSLWAASNNTIFILDLEALTIVKKLQRATKNKPMPVGQLKPTHDEKMMVSVVFGGSHISSWDIVRPSHICDINVMEFTRILKLDSITLISAMTPALDTIWVGMENGLIMVFSLEKPRLLTYFQPYNSYIRFLYCIRGPGVCESEEYLILCGGKHYHQESDGSNKQQTSRKKDAVDPGTVTVWEVVSASRLTQMCQLSSANTWINQETPNSSRSNSKSPNLLLHEENYATLIDFALEEPELHVDKHVGEDSSKEVQTQ